MDKIEKFLSKLERKELAKILTLINKIEKGVLLSLDVKKLVGYQDLYRVQQGNIRIIILKNGDSFEVISIERRSDNTYK